MCQYAIHDVHNLVNDLPSSIDDRLPAVRYLCALFSEFAYYHIPQWEIDDPKRAKIVPCEAYRVLVAGGRTASLNVVLRQLDLPEAFLVADRGVVAVVLVINRRLFIAFRGTQFLFDWKVNLRAKLVPVNASFSQWTPLLLGSVSGRLHVGFAEEAIRISTRVLDVIKDSNLGDIDHVFLTGHSLGGAVAAISRNFIRIAPTSVCIFGAPRYSNLSAYISLPDSLPAQVRRPGDAVPTVPPRAFGYADHPREFSTSGAPYNDFVPRSSTFSGFVRWARFLAGRFRSHDIEVYRRELGETARVEHALSPLAPLERLTAADMKQTKA